MDEYELEFQASMRQLIRDVEHPDERFGRRYAQTIHGDDQTRALEGAVEEWRMRADRAAARCALLAEQVAQWRQNAWVAFAMAMLFGGLLAVALAAR